jgi:hypothetical protein
MAAVDNSQLERWRGLPAAGVLAALADHVKEDKTFRSRGPTTRWHASVSGSEFEVLCTGARFFDTRAHRGGGGAVDLTMHLLNVTFKQAVAILVERSI